MTGEDHRLSRTGKITTYGFRWGPLKVERLGHVENRGYVIGIRTDRHGIDVYVSERGRSVRVFTPGGAEWKPSSGRSKLMKAPR